MARGRMAEKISKAAGKRLRSSNCPSCFPAFDQGGHGSPPATTSTPIIRCGIKFGDVTFNDIPVGPIQTKSLARMLVDLDNSGVIKACLFKAKSLTPSSSTQFERLA